MVTLPKWVVGDRPVAYGFCFNKAYGQYKMLRSVVKRRKIRGDPAGPKVANLEVYTVGVDEKWRNVGNALHPLHESFGNVIVTGSLHWIDGENLEANARICSFGIGTEKVKSLLAPPGLTTKYSYLSELRNSLCSTERATNRNHYYVDIWRMKQYGISESWTKWYHTRIPYCDFYELIVIWKDGEILMQSQCGHLVSYNRKGKQLRKVSVYGGSRAVARYFPSFYSLKTTMEERFEVSNVVPRLR